MSISESPLVSIVSPCYNSERYVGRMLKSILAQSYKNIEVICVNDGSTDSTGAVIRSYASAFEQNGMKLVYTEQPNGGLVSAINTGLKLTSGEYLSYLDSDDFFMPDSVEKRINTLLQNPDYSIVSANVNMVNEEDIGKVVRREGDYFGNLNYQPYQFYLLLSGMSLLIPGSYMIRMSDFVTAQGGKRIAPCAVGQSYQTLLPVYYRYKRLYIDEPLMTYVIRKDSDYHRERTEAQWLARNMELFRMLDNVLDSLGLPEWEKQKCRRLSCFHHGKS